MRMCPSHKATPELLGHLCVLCFYTAQPREVCLSFLTQQEHTDCHWKLLVWPGCCCIHSFCTLNARRAHGDTAGWYLVFPQLPTLFRPFLNYATQSCPQTWAEAAGGSSVSVGSNPSLCWLWVQAPLVCAPFSQCHAQTWISCLPPSLSCPCSAEIPIKVPAWHTNPSSFTQLLWLLLPALSRATSLPIPVQKPLCHVQLFPSCQEPQTHPRDLR